MADTDSVIVRRYADRMEKDKVPELGEFYDLKKDQRLTGLRILPTSDIVSGAVTATTTTVSQLQMTEMSSVDLSEKVDNMSIDATLNFKYKDMVSIDDAHFKMDQREVTKDGTVSIVKTARIVTHRRTITRQDIERAFRATEASILKADKSSTATAASVINNAVQFAQLKMNATHIAAEATYGHYVELRITYKEKTRTNVDERGGGGTGTVGKKGKFNFTVTGQVSVVDNTDLNEKHLEVSMRCSDPYQNVVLDGTLSGAELYSKATHSFNSIVSVLASKAKMDLAADVPEGNGTTLSFTYIPVTFLMTAGSVAQNLRDMAVQRQINEALGLRVVLQVTLDMYVWLLGNQLSTFNPRLQREMSTFIQDGQTERNELIADIAAMLSRIQQNGVNNAEADKVILRHKRVVLAFAARLRVSPYLQEQLAAVRRRAIELHDTSVTLATDVDELSPLSGTTAVKPARVAVVRQWAGRGETFRYELQRKSSTDGKAAPTGASAWNNVDKAAIEMMLEDGNRLANTVVSLAETRMPASCAVVDSMSLYDNVIVPEVFDDPFKTPAYVNGVKKALDKLAAATDGSPDGAWKTLAKGVQSGLAAMKSLLGHATATGKPDHYPDDAKMANSDIKTDVADVKKAARDVLELKPELGTMGMFADNVSTVFLWVASAVYPVAGKAGEAITQIPTVLGELSGDDKEPLRAVVSALGDVLKTASLFLKTSFGQHGIPWKGVGWTAELGTKWLSRGITLPDAEGGAFASASDHPKYLRDVQVVSAPSEEIFEAEYPRALKLPWSGAAPVYGLLCVWTANPHNAVGRVAVLTKGTLTASNEAESNLAPLDDFAQVKIKGKEEVDRVNAAASVVKYAYADAKTLALVARAAKTAAELKTSAKKLKEANDAAAAAKAEIAAAGDDDDKKKAAQAKSKKADEDAKTAADKVAADKKAADEAAAKVDGVVPPFTTWSWPHQQPHRGDDQGSDEDSDADYGDEDVAPMQRITEITLVPQKGKSEDLKVKGWYAVRLGEADDAPLLKYRVSPVPRLFAAEGQRFLEDGLYVILVDRALTKDQQKWQRGQKEDSKDLTDDDLPETAAQLEARLDAVGCVLGSDRIVRTAAFATKGGVIDDGIKPPTQAQRWRVTRCGYDAYEVSSVVAAGARRVWSMDPNASSARALVSVTLPSRTLVQRVHIRPDQSTAADATAALRYDVTFAASEQQLSQFFSPKFATTNTPTTTRQLESRVEVGKSGLTVDRSRADAMAFTFVPVGV